MAGHYYLGLAKDYERALAFAGISKSLTLSASGAGHLDSRRGKSQRVRMARRAAGLSQSALAEKLGLSRSAAAQWESSKGSSPSTDNLGKLAVVLGCSYEWLATGRGGRVPSATSGAHPAEDTTEVLRYFARDDAEEHLLATFRQLDHWDRRSVGQLADTLASRPGQARRK